MWFLLNPPGNATVNVESIDNFQWLATKYDVTLGKEGSADQRYTSELNHLRFYLPDIFPRLNKIVFLDHDVVVKKDLTRLWSIDMRGKVNGAVETCKEGEISFHRMDMLIDFTDPMVAKKFKANSCTWAFGMNLFDLNAWRRRNLTVLYHKYLRLVSKLHLKFIHVPAHHLHFVFDRISFILLFTFHFPLDLKSLLDMLIFLFSWVDRSQLKSDSVKNYLL